MLCLDIAIGGRWREVLLNEAHERLVEWYGHPSLLAVSQVRSGVAVGMMKEDRECGGLGVPVVLSSFNVSGARPVDVFNTMLNLSAQLEWNDQIKSVTLIGDYKEQGARGWSITFGVPLAGDREFVQWEAADADFSKEEFWIVYSTLNNQLLIQDHPAAKGSIAAQQCLGAYHITKNVDGSAHVVVTQNVNAQVPLPFPLHLALSLFPPAWSYTIKFVNQLSDQSRLQASLGWNKGKTDAPAFMLQHAAYLQNPSTIDMLFPKQRATAEVVPGSILVYVLAALACVTLCICAMCICLCCRRKARAQKFVCIQSEDSDDEFTSLSE